MTDDVARVKASIHPEPEFLSSSSSLVHEGEAACDGQLTIIFLLDNCIILAEAAGEDGRHKMRVLIRLPNKEISIGPDMISLETFFIRTPARTFELKVLDRDARDLWCERIANVIRETMSLPPLPPAPEQQLATPTYMPSFNSEIEMVEFPAAPCASDPTVPVLSPAIRYPLPPPPTAVEVSPAIITLRPMYRVVIQRPHLADLYQDTFPSGLDRTIISEEEFSEVIAALNSSPENDSSTPCCSGPILCGMLIYMGVSIALFLVLAVGGFPVPILLPLFVVKFFLVSMRFGLYAARRSGDGGRSYRDTIEHIAETLFAVNNQMLIDRPIRWRMETELPRDTFPQLIVVVHPQLAGRREELIRVV